MFDLLKRHLATDPEVSHFQLRATVHPKPLPSTKGHKTMSLRKTAASAAALVLFVSGLLPSVYAQEAEMRAATEYEVTSAVAKASRAWRDAFNSGNATATAALYEEDAIIVAKPFGTFTGQAEIEALWQNLITQGYDDVIYENTIIKILDEKSARVSANWTMNKGAGIITNELWVVQPDGRALLQEDHFEVTK